MSKKILGIEIGNYSLKIAVCSGNNIEKVVTARIPDNIVREDAIVSWEAMADFIKEVISKEGISVKNTSIVLPDKLCYIKRTTVTPAMTIDQLRFNLPYEFHDYIASDKDKYIYDYAVIETLKDENGAIKGHDLMAVAVLKETVEKYQTLMKRAGLKLKKIVPEFCGFNKIIDDFQNLHPGNEKTDYAFLDIGHDTVKLRFFSKGVYEITRRMEPGSEAITRLIADINKVDIHIADINKINNQDGILDSDECHRLYHQTAVDIMRVLNFYNFSYPGNTVDKVYYCGGGALNKALIDDIDNAIEPELVSVRELYNGNIVDDDMFILAVEAVGIALE